MLRFEPKSPTEVSIYRVSKEGTDPHIGTLSLVPGAAHGVLLSTCMTDHLTIDEMRQCLDEYNKQTKICQYPGCREKAIAQAMGKGEELPKWLCGNHNYHVLYEAEGIETVRSCPCCGVSYTDCWD